MIRNILYLTLGMMLSLGLSMRASNPPKLNKCNRQVEQDYKRLFVALGNFNCHCVAFMGNAANNKLFQTIRTEHFAIQNGFEKFETLLQLRQPFPVRHAARDLYIKAWLSRYKAENHEKEMQALQTQLQQAAVAAAAQQAAAQKKYNNEVQSLLSTLQHIQKQG